MVRSKFLTLIQEPISIGDKMQIWFSVSACFIALFIASLVLSYEENAARSELKRFQNKAMNGILQELELINLQSAMLKRIQDHPGKRFCTNDESMPKFSYSYDRPIFRSVSSRLTDLPGAVQEVISLYNGQFEAAGRWAREEAVHITTEIRAQRYSELLLNSGTYIAKLKEAYWGEVVSWDQINSEAEKKAVERLVMCGDAE